LPSSSIFFFFFFFFFGVDIFDRRYRYSQAAASASDEPLYWSNLASSHLLANNFGEALEASEKHLTLDPKNAGGQARYKSTHSSDSWKMNGSLIPLFFSLFFSFLFFSPSTLNVTPPSPAMQARPYCVQAGLVHKSARASHNRKLA
jgi:hypothetical protein